MEKFGFSNSLLRSTVMFYRTAFMLFVIMMPAFAFPFTIEKSVVRKEMFASKEGSIVVHIEYDEDQHSFFCSAEGRNVDIRPRIEGIQLLSFIEPLRIPFVWIDKPFDGRLIETFQLDTDEVLAGLINEYGAAIIDRIPSMFSAEIYSQNKEYVRLKSAADEKSKTAAAAADRKALDEKTEAERKQAEENRRAALYAEIKSGTARAREGLTCDDIFALYALMSADRFGEEKISDNANELQRKKIGERNKKTHAQTADRFSSFVSSCTLTSEFIFSSMKNYYTPKKAVYARIMKDARQAAVQNLAAENVYYSSLPASVPKSAWDELVDKHANDLIQSYPKSFGKDNEYTITYSMCGAAGKMLNENRSARNGDSMYDAVVEIRNVPDSFIENHSLNTLFSFEGKALEAREVNDCGKNNLRIVFDFGRLMKIEVIKSN